MPSYHGHVPKSASGKIQDWTELHSIDKDYYYYYYYYNAMMPSQGQVFCDKLCAAFCPITYFPFYSEIT